MNEQDFDRQIREEKNQIKELKEAFDIIAFREAFDIVADKLAAVEQRERDLKPLLISAADALEVMTQFLLISDVPLEWEESRRKENMALIRQLRKAAQ